MLSDDDIVTALSDVLPLEESLEAYPGTWQEPPYADRDGRAVLGLGEDSWDVLLDRDTTRLEGVPEAADPFLLSSSLDRFVRSTQAVTAAFEQAEHLEAEVPGDAVDDPDPGTGSEDDEDPAVVLEEISERLAARLREIDPEALADDTGFWSVLAEELGHGL